MKPKVPLMVRYSVQVKGAEMVKTDDEVNSVSNISLLHNVQFIRSLTCSYDLICKGESLTCSNQAIILTVHPEKAINLYTV